MKGKIAITPRSLSRSGHPALCALEEKGYELIYPSPGQTPSAEQLQQDIPSCVAWLAGVEPITPELLVSARDLRVISRNGTGVDNVPLDAAAAQGIQVERTLAANARGVAELAIALMLAGFRHIPWSDAKLRHGQWERRVGAEVQGRTLGVVGCGAIGRQVGEMAIGLGMRVVGYDPYPNPDFAPDGFRYGDLPDIWEHSDAVTFHCPPADRPLIDASVVATLKHGVVIVNTARAGLLDDAAILAGLQADKIGCLATDVFHTEPPQPSDLLAHERVIQMPHAGGLTKESVDRATRGAVDNILKVLEAE